MTLILGASSQEADVPIDLADVPASYSYDPVGDDSDYNYGDYNYDDTYGDYYANGIGADLPAPILAGGDLIPMADDSGFNINARAGFGKRRGKPET